MTDQSSQFLLEASNPTTSPLRLGRLASSGNRELRHAVAGNPNTPSEVLWRLAVRDASAVLQNPVLGFLILENPNFLAELPEFARLSLLRTSQTPQAWLDWVFAWGDQDSKVHALQNPNLKPELLEALEHKFLLESGTDNSSKPGDSEASFLAFLVRGHVNHPNKLEFESATKTLHDLLPSLEHDGEHLKDAVALGLVPDWLLKGLSLDDDAQLRLMLAKDSADQTLLFHLCFDDDDEVRAAARANQNISTSTLERLSRVEHHQILEALDIELLETGGVQALTYLARNSSVDLAVLASLITHSDWRVRQALVLNPELPAELLEQLGDDEDKDVRIAVAQHPNASTRMLEFLVGDAVEEVRQAVQANPNANPAWNVLLEQVEHGDETVSLEALQTLCERGGWSRQLALKHPNLTLEVLESYLTGDNWHDRVAAAHNSNLSAAMLEMLSLDTDSDVRQAVAMHPNLEAGLLEKFIQDEQFEIRKSAALNPKIDTALLETLAHDEHWAVRQAVAQHKAASRMTLTTLLEDSDNDVRIAARAALNVQEPSREDSVGSTNLLEFYRGWFEDHPHTHAKLEVERFLEELGTGQTGRKNIQLENGEQHEIVLISWQGKPIFEIPNDVVSQLVRDAQWRVRQEVAGYPFVPRMSLARLCLDSDSDVRTAAAGNPNSSRTMLCKLAGDEVSSVRAAIVNREDAPLEALQLLCCDSEPEIRAAALKHPNTPFNVAEKFERLHTLDPKLNVTQLEELAQNTPTAHAWIAKHPNVTAKLLEQLGWREHWRLREAAASNPKLERVVLEQLAQDTDLDVLRALARNSSTSNEVLLQLIAHSDSSVRRTALENKNLEPETLQQLRCACVRQGLRSTQVFNRVLALESDLVPKLELRKHRHLHAAHPAERIALCLSSNLPDDARAILQHDANILVRSSALEVKL
jgi:Leucine rich repeat variant